jgi:hypothetical protein
MMSMKNLKFRNIIPTKCLLRDECRSSGCDEGNASQSDFSHIFGMVTEKYKLW